MLAGLLLSFSEFKLSLSMTCKSSLEGQRLVAELLPDSGTEPDFEGFHASKAGGKSQWRREHGIGTVTKSDDDGLMGRLVMQRQLQHTGRILICQIRVRPHGR